MWHYLTSKHKPQLYSLWTVQWLHQTQHKPTSSVSSSLALPLLTYLSVLSFPPYGCTIFVNIYFCMMDMKSLYSLLLQKDRVKSSSGLRSQCTGHLRAAQMLINKENWTWHWISSAAMARLTPRSHRDLIISEHHKRNQNDTPATFTLKADVSAFWHCLLVCLFWNILNITVLQNLVLFNSPVPTIY